MIDLYFVGRFAIRQKRIDRLLQLAQLLDIANFSYRFKIFSEIDIDSALYESFKNNKSFEFLGFKKDWVNYVNEESIMIFVSDYEGCPLSILEAYNNNFKKIAILDMAGINSYVSINCIAENLEIMAQKIVSNSDLFNSVDLSTYYNKQRFETEVKRFYEFI
ncbi:glycosyltransferase [Flavobacterium anhuiense]|uniref:glycosyltransferase n=1 Tax=Flavobacterium anhuiense TaxID=459526 RepID=UPI002025E4BD|nr:glycosyltransferase [Flavobacterium anhuiense]URM37352.1 glycosyltransferase [Flavobacterium anhuiense]